jgi:hypothetical protein
MEEHPLSGGVANAGSVTRVGQHVLRPRNPHSEAIADFLATMTKFGFDGVPRPDGVTTDGRDRFLFIEGRVPIPPYPDWSQRDEVLASVAHQLREFHAASARYDYSACAWSDEMADPAGGPLICHNDVCLENVVFDGDAAVGLLDFDFAAPGRHTFDVAAFARMCVPIDDEANAARNWWIPADRPRRLRLLMDTYGLDAVSRLDIFGELARSMRDGGEFVRRRVRSNDPNFLKMWNEMGGERRFSRRRDWWALNEQRYLEAIN